MRGAESLGAALLFVAAQAGLFGAECVIVL